VSERIERSGTSVIVFDDVLLDHADECIFVADEQIPDPLPPAQVAGRGATRFITFDGRPCVMRHYYRGGRIRPFVEDSFVWTGADRTRSFREWRLLAELRRRALPVPRPVAARYVRRGIFYRADLITERLSGVQSLAALLGAGPLGAETWRRIGATLARFHAENVFHADLNADNIQLDAAAGVYLLDFDRGRIMTGGGAWRARNLRRLRRSLDKTSRENGAHFEAGDWDTMTGGYASA